MSWWGTLEARFVCKSAGEADELRTRLARDFEERTAPTGPEYGPSVVRSGNAVLADGRLRDVDDLTDSAEVLAWFCRTCDAYMLREASLMWELDGGPRYRWAYTPKGGLARLRGVLDA